MSWDGFKAGPVLGAPVHSCRVPHSSWAWHDPACITVEQFSPWQCDRARASGSVPVHYLGQHEGSWFSGRSMRRFPSALLAPAMGRRGWVQRKVPQQRLVGGAGCRGEQWDGRQERRQGQDRVPVARWMGISPPQPCWALASGSRQGPKQSLSCCVWRQELPHAGCSWLSMESSAVVCPLSPQGILTHFLSLLGTMLLDSWQLCVGQLKAGVSILQHPRGGKAKATRVRLSKSLPARSLQVPGTGGRVRARHGPRGHGPILESEAQQHSSRKASPCWGRPAVAAGVTAAPLHLAGTTCDHHRQRPSLRLSPAPHWRKLGGSFPEQVISASVSPSLVWAVGIPQHSHH